MKIHKAQTLCKIEPRLKSVMGTGVGNVKDEETHYAFCANCGAGPFMHYYEINIHLGTTDSKSRGIWEGAILARLGKA